MVYAFSAPPPVDTELDGLPECKAGFDYETTQRVMKAKEDCRLRSEKIEIAYKGLLDWKNKEVSHQKTFNKGLTDE